LHEEFLYFQGQTTNAYAFLLINGSLNEDKELNLTINHRSPRAKRFVNYALKTGMEGVQNVKKEGQASSSSLPTAAASGQSSDNRSCAPHPSPLA
jgi:hypothetical protein